MSVYEAIEAELDRLECDTWDRALALRLAETVDEAGTASAAGLLRSMMHELAGEGGPSSDAISALRAAVKPPGARGKSAQKKAPEKSTESRKVAPKSPIKSVLPRVCVDCGADLPPQSRGRPRVRCRNSCA